MVINFEWMDGCGNGWLLYSLHSLSLGYHWYYAFRVVVVVVLMTYATRP